MVTESLQCVTRCSQPCFVPLWLVSPLSVIVGLPGYVYLGLLLSVSCLRETVQGPGQPLVALGVV